MANEQVNLELVLSANLQNFSSQLDSLANRKIDIPIRFTSDANALSADLAKTRREAQLVVDSSKALTGNLKGQRDILQSQAFELKQIAINAKQNLQQSGRTAAFYQQQLKALDGATAAIKGNRSQYEALNAKILEAARTTSSFKDRLKELGDQAKASVQQKTEGFFDSLLGKLTLGGVLVEGFKQILQGLGSFIQRGIEFEQLQLGLQAFTGSVDEADRAYESFKQTALETPFDVAGVAQAGKTMLAFGLDTEVALDATDRLAVIAGATGSDLNNLARNLGQISAQGRAYTRDLNQFATAGIPIYQKLADVLGVSVQEVRKLAEEGSIGFAEVDAAIKALTSTGSAFSNLAARQLDTVQGQLGNLSTALTEFSGAIVQALGPSVVSGLKVTSAAITALAANFETLSSVITGIFAAAFIGKAVPAILSFASGVRALVSLVPALITAFQGVAAASAASASSAAFYSNTAIALSRNLATLTTVIGAVTKAVLVFAAKTVVFAVVAGAVALLVSTLKSYKPTEALKEDAKRTAEFSKAIDELNAKTGTLVGTTPKLSKSFKDFAKAADLDRAKDGFIVTQLALNKLNANLDKFASNTAKAAAANQKLVQSNTAYLTSSNKSIQATRDQISLTADRINALQEENKFLEANAVALQAEANAAKVPAVRAAILEQIALVRARAAANKAIIPDLQKQQSELSRLITVTNAYNQALADPSKENLKIFLEEASTAYDKLAKYAKAYQAVETANAEGPVNQLKFALAQITAQYDIQIGKLDVVLGKYNSIINAINARIALETRQEYGAERRKADLLDRQIVLTDQLRQARQRLNAASTPGESAAARIEIRNIQQQQIELAKQLKYFPQLEAAQNKVAQAGADKARAEAESADAASGTLVALRRQEVAANLVVQKIALQVAEFDKVGAAIDVAATKIDAGITGGITDAIGQADILAGKIRNLPNVNVNSRFAGGPVNSGSSYTVNELGKEAFLSASGRLSMINAPAWGTWRAPSSGTVIPAHLTKQLNIPAGGINLNSSRALTANRRVHGVHNNSGVRTDLLLNRLHSTQQVQAEQLGKLTRVISVMADKEWSVDVNINGNNPLLNKLRRH